LSLTQQERSDILTKKIVFDFDGTLVDTKVAYCQAMASAFAEKDIEISPEEVSEFLFPNITGTIAEILTAMGRFQRDLLAELVQETIDTLSAAWFGNVKLVDGIMDLLDELKSNGSELYLVSNSHSSFVLPALTEFQLGEYFNNVVTLDTGYNDKSESLRYVAHNAGCMVGELVYVADTMMDAQIADEMGLPLIVLMTESSWDYERKDELKEALKGRNRIDIAKNLKDVKKILNKYIEESGEFC
jgi:phosphoglycolate phosphatase-like HAD superfamily hydrolase